MKRILLPIFFLLAVTAAAKEQTIWIVTMKNGAEYAACEYREIEDARVAITYRARHGNGFITIKRPKSEVKSVEAMSVESPPLRIDKPEEEAKKEPEWHEITLLDLKTDTRQHVDARLVTKVAVMKLSNYFDYGYRDCRTSHVAFEINDGTSKAYVYGPRDWEGTEKLRQALLKHELIIGTFKVMVYSSRYDSAASDIHAELLGHSLAPNYLAP